MKHENNGKCPKCKALFDAFPDFNKNLRSWFIMFQAKHPEAHISCAGRGAADQMAALAAKASRAKFGESAHNYNCAIDLFVMDHKNYPNNIYPKKWFETVLAPEIPYFLNWYGDKGSKFYELPHVEVRDWRGLRSQGLAQLVESDPEKGSVA